MIKIINMKLLILQILWTFSIYLESVAILPQLFMVSKTGEAETITSHYLFALGSYRALYLFNWIYRYYAEGFFDLIAVVAGVVQTILYCDFFYLYITKGLYFFFYFCNFNFFIKFIMSLISVYEISGRPIDNVYVKSSWSMSNFQNFECNVQWGLWYCKI